jgi:predicted Rdx family selenoprotein
MEGWGFGLERKGLRFAVGVAVELLVDEVLNGMAKDLERVALRPAGATTLKPATGSRAAGHAGSVGDVVDENVAHGGRVWAGKRSGGHAHRDDLADSSIGGVQVGL